jgi:hypothetical protein
MPMRLYVYMPLYASGCGYAPGWLAGWLTVWWALSPPSHLIQCSRDGAVSEIVPDWVPSGLIR